MPEEVKPTPSPIEPPKPLVAEPPPVPAVVATAVVEPPKISEPTKEPTPPKPVVPERYDLKVAADSLLDARDVKRIETIAKTRGLSNEQAQGFLEEQSTAYAALVDEQSTAWMSEAQSDKEIGGDAFKQSAELAKRVIDRFGSDSLKRELNRTGYGNHPELIRLFSRLGKGMSDDQLVLPGAQAGTKKSMEDIFYGETKN